MFISGARPPLDDIRSIERSAFRSNIQAEGIGSKAKAEESAEPYNPERHLLHSDFATPFYLFSSNPVCLTMSLQVVLGMTAISMMKKGFAGSASNAE